MLQPGNVNFHGTQCQPPSFQCKSMTIMCNDLDTAFLPKQKGGLAEVNKPFIFQCLIFFFFSLQIKFNFQPWKAFTSLVLCPWFLSWRQEEDHIYSPWPELCKLPEENIENNAKWYYDSLNFNKLTHAFLWNCLRNPIPSRANPIQCSYKNWILIWSHRAMSHLLGSTWKCTARLRDLVCYWKLSQ